MRKILIIGIVASGKTTFAKKLSDILNIPYYELDDIVHNKEIKGRPKRTVEEQKKHIRNICLNDDWIFEGVHRESYKELYNMADTIVYLDIPLIVRIKRIITRYIKQQLKIEHSHYKSTLKMLKYMLKWTKDFEKKRHDYEHFINKFSDKLVWLKHPREVKGWLKRVIG